MSTPLLDKYYPEHQTQHKTRILDRLISDLWYQHPLGPTTYSSCADDGCPNMARGGHLCKTCLTEVMAELVGMYLAGKYASAVFDCVVCRRELEAAVENVHLSDRHE